MHADECMQVRKLTMENGALDSTLAATRQALSAETARGRDLGREVTELSLGLVEREGCVGLLIGEVNARSGF